MWAVKLHSNKTFQFLTVVCQQTQVDLYGHKMVLFKYGRRKEVNSWGYVLQKPNKPYSTLLDLRP